MSFLLMLIGFNDSDVERICVDAKYAEQRLGKRVANKLFQRMEWLSAANNLHIFNTQYAFLRIHKLKGNYKDCYAIDITERYRIVFYPCNEDGEYDQSDFRYVSIITILEVNNHYGD